MKVTTQEIQALADVQRAPRFDLYTGIHKALRALMSDTLLAVGRMDVGDAAAMTQTSQRVLELLEFCRGHLGHENAFVHTAMEKRAPGASARIAHEHAEHEQHIVRLEAMVCALLRAEPVARADAASTVYQQLSLFVADNFQHMFVEETEHNAVLWSNYSDAELVGIHNALVASIPPAEMLFTLRWMLPFMNAAERTAMLADMQLHAPAPAFAAALDTLRPHLTDSEWAKLASSLGLPAVPGLMVWM